MDSIIRAHLSLGERFSIGWIVINFPKIECTSAAAAGVLQSYPDLQMLIRVYCIPTSSRIPAGIYVSSSPIARLQIP
jgi:hypothetical protein